MHIEKEQTDKIEVFKRCIYPNSLYLRKEDEEDVEEMQRAYEEEERRKQEKRLPLSIGGEGLQLGLGYSIRHNTVHINH